MGSYEGGDEEMACAELLDAFLALFPGISDPCSGQVLAPRASLDSRGRDSRISVRATKCGAARGGFERIVDGLT